MKKRLNSILIFFVVMIFAVSSVFGSVTVKLFKTSEIVNPGGNNILTVSCKTQSTYTYNITKFRGSFSMGSTLEGLYSSAVFSNHFFNALTYSREFGTTDEDELWFNYQVTSTTKGDTATLDDMDTTPWQTMFDVTITYPFTGGQYSSFSWSQDTLPTAMIVIVYFQFPGGKVPVEYNVNTGGQLIDPDLIDYSLPVEMGEIVGVYNLNGITLSWETISEVDNLGFEISRFKEQKDLSGKLGEYEKISDLIEGAGNSSVGKQYTFVDSDVKTNKIYTYRINQLSTNGTVEDTYYIMVSTKVPESIELNQNYPNPFNPETKIIYTLPEQSHVKLKIYNILGKEIRTLIDETKGANVHTAVWDGRDGNGVNVPSGIYFYKLEAGKNVQVKKMMKLQ